MKEQPFCHLHTHDEFSLLDGLGTVVDSARTAAEQGFTAHAQTNHGTIDGLLKHLKACKKWGIRPVCGCELYYVDDREKKPKKEKRRHLTVLIKDATGFASLNKILTLSHLDGFYRRPRADKSLILDNLSGLIILSGCVSGPLSVEEDFEFALQLLEQVGDDFYLEIMPHDFNLQYTVNELALEIHKKTGVPLVATNDVHYPLQSDTKLHEVLLAIQSKSRWNSPTRWKFSIDGLYQRNYQEMVKAFEVMETNTLTSSQIEEALRNTLDIAEKCIFDPRESQPNLPAPLILKDTNESPADLLTRVCYEGYEQKIKEDPEDIYLDRMVHELSMLVDLGFERYFLMVYDLVSWCREQDIMVGPGRGSVGGSLVAFLLGITAVDPIKYDLIFERFISPDRIDLPDIDLDFEVERRGEVIEYLKNTYGEYNVAQVSTFGKMKGRTALRDVGRVFDLPYVDVDKAAKSIPDGVQEQVREGHTLEDAFNTFEEGKLFKKKYPEVTDFASRLEGQVRQHGKHPAGVVVSDESFSLGKLGYLTRRGRDTVMVNWDKREIEYFGLIKMDLLGLAALSVLKHCRQLIKQHHGVDIDFESLELNDPKVLREFDIGNTVGIFQFGSRNMRKFCPEIGVSEFKDLYHINALFRPGPLREGVAESYRKRKYNEESVQYLHPAMQKFTLETYGLIVYQEQVMRLFRDFAGFSWKVCDQMRKVIGKSLGVRAFKKFEKQFIDGCVQKNTLSAVAATKVFDELKSHGSYSFNKAHAVSYSLLASWQMWCKFYYPAEYMAAQLSVEDKQEKITDLMKDIRRLNIGIRLPSLNKSHAQYWRVDYSEGEPVLVCPLLYIKGVGEKVASSIAEAKEKNKVGFKTLEEFLEIVDKRVCNKKVVNILILTGVLDELEDVEAMDRTETAKDFLPWDVISPYLEYESLIARLGESLDVRTIGDLEQNHVSQTVFMAGRITGLELKYSKEVKEGRSASAGEARASAVLEDQETFISLLFDEDVFKKQKSIIEHLDGSFVLVKGSRAPRKSGFIVTRLWPLEGLKKGRFGRDGPLPLIKEVNKIPKALSKAITKCAECHVREECKTPVPYSEGAIPAMVVAEAPGKDEEIEGKGLVGTAGKELWKRMTLGRSMFHVTNVLHCRPKNNRTPDKKEARFCGGLWLELEMEKVRPFVVLALGNISRGFFTGEYTGITEANGGVEWNDKHQCWVVYGMHPASVLYHWENATLLEKACERFEKLISFCAG